MLLECVTGGSQAQFELTVGVSGDQAFQRNAMNVPMNLAAASVDELGLAARLLSVELLFAIETDRLLADFIGRHPGDDHFGRIGCC